MLETKVPLYKKEPVETVDVFYDVESQIIPNQIQTNVLINQLSLLLNPLKACIFVFNEIYIVTEKIQNRLQSEEYYSNLILPQLTNKLMNN